MKKRILSMVLCIAMLMSMVAMLSGCKNEGGNQVDAFVIMTENLDGLFNPFYYTAANDGTIVSMTQISMIGAKYVNGQIEVAYGEDEAVVTKDYEIVDNGDGTTSYYFVLKNGIKFSDGHPLTMEDVLFNYYVYLDPVYTGSNTLYSTKILGLAEYRTQKTLSGSDNGDDVINSGAAAMANDRNNALITLFQAQLKQSTTNDVSIQAMKDAINGYELPDSYKEAISNNPSEVTSAQMLADYEHALELFRAELGRDYASAQESFTDAPYNAAHLVDFFKDPVFKFMYFEGYVDTKYALGEDGKIDRTKIESVTKKYGDNIDTMEEAINYVYESTVTNKLDEILTYWATAGELLTEYTAKAKEVLLHANKGENGLAIDSISGIVSLGHTEQAGSTITVNGKEYTIAKEHDDNGAPVNANEYDVLKITIDGIDPKAIWNFSLTVAPQHYYGDDEKYPVDIANNQFGVSFASFQFMTEVVQSARNIKLPMGAGSYKCTDVDNNDNPKAENFYKNNVVYFKANDQFQTVGEGLNNAKIGKIRYQVVSSNNAINALKEGTVHYISPAMTTLNYKQLTDMESQGFVKLSTDQLGYGYIGVNARHVKDQNIRKAIMCAMNTSLAIGYYEAGTASQIFWNMSKVSWAYPTGEDENYNGKDYPQQQFNKDIATENIQKYMAEANVAPGSDKLKFTFTIAGSTLQDHPCYAVFRDAAALLNSLGWNVQVVCDTQALTKIATGSLQVWAAAWGSALDPDMYQVYHKNSNATSTKAWGYDYLLSSAGSPEEQAILNELSDLIDQARETYDQGRRSELYKQAMGLILDLAVELPVYQRDVLYAYNANVLNVDSMPNKDELNPYSSPLDRIWEIEFAAN